jgi:cysteine desulfurase
MIYLDNAASTRLLPEVRAAMAPFLDEECGNASSLHAAGRRARKALEDAREAVARCLGGDPKEVLFTSCATESNNLVVAGVAEAFRGKGNHVVTTAIEHPCILEACARLESRGFRVTRVAPGRDGLVDAAAVGRAVTPATVLVSVMGVNNETGAVQPIAEIRRAAPGAVLHTDAAQAVGKVPVDVRDVDLLTFSAHKMHGPKGVGGLWVRRGTPLAPQLVGGGQEFERRAGTENVAGVVGLAEAMKRAVGSLAENAPQVERLRRRLEEGLLAVGAARVNGHPARRAPHIANVTFDHVDGEAIILALDAEGVCVSSGSACASLGMEPSHVLKAMGLSDDEARGSVRFSLSALTTEEEVEGALKIVPRVIEKLRRISASR